MIRVVYTQVKVHICPTRRSTKIAEIYIQVIYVYTTIGVPVIQTKQRHIVLCCQINVIIWCWSLYLLELVELT